jgi:hypothetical protein
MRFMLTFRFPTDTGNELARNGTSLLRALLNVLIDLLGIQGVKTHEYSKTP